MRYRLQKPTASPAVTSPGVAVRKIPDSDLRHVYDPHYNCFRVRDHLAASLVSLHHSNVSLHQQDGLMSVSPLTLSYEVEREESAICTTPEHATQAESSASCYCGLDIQQLFNTASDIPSPPLPLSRCELHEILAALPPRLQEKPWQLCFDTAVHGFSLSTFYRRMEAVESRPHSVAFGLWFVEAATEPSVGVDRPCADDQGPPPPHQSGGVFGCFAPEVPCAAHHSANVYFGSTETFVFRLNTAGVSGSWMSAARMAPPQHSHRQSDAESNGAASKAAQQRRPQVQPLWESKSVSLFENPQSPTQVPEASSLCYDSSMPALPTCTSAEEPSIAIASLASPLQSSLPRSPALEAATAPPPTLSPKARTGALVRRGAPLLEKYPWAGDKLNRRFIVCNRHFLCIGGGRDGAAIYTDESIRHGTTCRLCETFDSPYLFNPAAADSAAAVAGSDESRSQMSATAAATSGRSAHGFSHVEFDISRMVWFALLDEKASPHRCMSSSAPLSGSQQPGSASSLGSVERGFACSCGGGPARSGEAATDDFASSEPVVRLGMAAPHVSLPSHRQHTPQGSLHFHRCPFLLENLF